MSTPPPPDTTGTPEGTLPDLEAVPVQRPPARRLTREALLLAGVLTVAALTLGLLLAAYVGLVIRLAGWVAG